MLQCFKSKRLLQRQVSGACGFFSYPANGGARADCSKKRLKLCGAFSGSWRVHSSLMRSRLPGRSGGCAVWIGRTNTSEKGAAPSNRRCYYSWWSGIWDTKWHWPTWCVWFCEGIIEICARRDWSTNAKNIAPLLNAGWQTHLQKVLFEKPI